MKAPRAGIRPFLRILSTIKSECAEPTSQPEERRDPIDGRGAFEEADGEEILRRVLFSEKQRRGEWRESGRARPRHAVVSFVSGPLTRY